MSQRSLNNCVKIPREFGEPGTVARPRYSVLVLHHRQLRYKEILSVSGLQVG